MNKEMFLNFFNNQGKIYIFKDKRVVSEASDAELKNMIFDFIDKDYFFIIKDSKFYTNSEITQDPYLMRVQKLICMTKEKWIKKYPQIPFPLIVIKNKAEDDSLFLNSVYYEKESKIGTIYISPETFLNFHELRFTLGHELGHLTYTKSNTYYNFNHKNIISIYIILSTLISLFLLFYEKETSIILKSITFAFPTIMLFYYISCAKSFQERMEKYNMELYCDFFSFKFMEINFYKRKNIFKIGSEFLGKTHPRKKDRFYFLKKNRKNKDFKEISQKDSKFFRFYFL